MEEFNVDVSQYTATLKKVIAACMDGVEPEEIIQMVVTSFTSTGERVTGLRALQEGGDAISVSYEVQVDDSSASFESLSTELVQAVTTGEFDTILQETATEDGSVALEDGTSDTVTVEDLLPDAAPGAPTVAPTASPDPKKEVLFYAEQVRFSSREPPRVLFGNSLPLTYASFSDHQQHRSERVRHRCVPLHQHTEAGHLCLHGRCRAH
jgi:hypothetical protein